MQKNKQYDCFVNYRVARSLNLYNSFTLAVVL